MTPSGFSRWYAIFLMIPLLAGAAVSQEYLIDDFTYIGDWQLVENYGAGISRTDFNGTTLQITNMENYGDVFTKVVNLEGGAIKYGMIQFPFYSNQTYSDLVLRIVDMGGNERCAASITFGSETGIWQLFNRTIADFQNCMDKYISTIGTISLVVSDYPTDVYIGPIFFMASNYTEESGFVEPGEISIYGQQISPETTPRGRPLSVSCYINSESYLKNVTINIRGMGYDSTFLMEKVSGNFTDALYRYIFDPPFDQPEGAYDVMLIAWDYGGNTTSSYGGSFMVNATLSVEFETDKQVYNTTEKLLISGTAVDINRNGVTGNASVSLESGAWSESFSDGPFIASFDMELLPADAPPGWMNITVFFDDGHGNIGESMNSVYISEPETPGYSINIIEPVNQSSHFAGETLGLSAVFLADGEPSQTEELFVIFDGDVIPMSSNGSLYLSSVELERTGLISISFVVPDVVTNQTYVNVCESPEIDPILFPPSLPPGGSADLLLNLTYPNGTPMSGANVSLGTPGSNIQLSEVGDGLYNGTYTASDRDAGYWNFSITINNLTTGTGIGMRVEINLLNMVAIILIVSIISVAFAKFVLWR